MCEMCPAYYAGYYVAYMCLQTKSLQTLFPKLNTEVLNLVAQKS